MKEGRISSCEFRKFMKFRLLSDVSEGGLYAQAIRRLTELT